MRPEETEEERRQRELEELVAMFKGGQLDQGRKSKKKTRRSTPSTGGDRENRALASAQSLLQSYGQNSSPDPSQVEKNFLARKRREFGEHMAKLGPLSGAERDSSNAPKMIDLETGKEFLDMNEGSGYEEWQIEASHGRPTKARPPRYIDGDARVYGADGKVDNTPSDGMRDLVKAESGSFGVGGDKKKEAGLHRRAMSFLKKIQADKARGGNKYLLSSSYSVEED